MLSLLLSSILQAAAPNPDHIFRQYVTYTISPVALSQPAFYDFRAPATTNGSSTSWLVEANRSASFASHKIAFFV